METKLKVIIADNQTELGATCSKVFQSYGMEVALCEKDAQSFWRGAEASDPM